MMYLPGRRAERRTLVRSCLAGAFAILGVGLLPASVSAALTGVYTPDSREDTHGSIFSRVYGGSFVAGPGGSYTSGTVVAQRIDDDFDSTFVTTGFGATVKAVFANYSQSFGYLPGDGEEETSAGFVELFDVTDSRYNAQGSAEGVVIDGVFRFARNGSQGVLASSQADDNPGGADHLVTYLITPLLAAQDASTLAVPSFPILMLFFEDTGGSRSDRDFQDLVVEVRGATPIDLARAPEPGTAALVLAAVGGALLRRRG